MHNLEPALLAPVVAHRGASGLAPENTLAALRLAADQGARCVEIDVSISKDGVPFVHHDDKLDRCTSGNGLLCEKNASELDTLSADKGMPGYTGEPLPRLTAVIDLLAKHRLGLNLEIKPKSGLEQATTQAICDVIQQHWPADLTLVFSSFNQSSLKTARQHLPDVARALIVGGVPTAWKKDLESLGCRNLHCAQNRIQAVEVDALRTAGYGVYCYTVNDTTTASRLLKMGVHGVFTDYPGTLLHELPELQTQQLT